MLPLTPQQLHWATVIVHTCRHTAGIGDPDHHARAADIALQVALAESGLRMTANGNNPRSLTLPHDAVGWDHGSVGLFQQQVTGALHSTASWGTTEQCMDAVWSTRRFLSELVSFRWTELPNWLAAQRVQNSFDPLGENYRRWDATAIATRKHLWDAAK